MRNLVSKRQMEMLLAVLASIFFAALTAYLIFNLYLPAKEKREQTAVQLAAERDILYSLQKRLADTEMNETTSSAPLQKIVPVIPLEDALLVRLEKAEVKSDSRIEEVAFSKASFEAENLPKSVAGLETIVMEVHVKADTYDQIDTFIYEIEEMLRIMNVQSIDFTSTEEKREAKEQEDELELTITIQAFYRPDLDKLKDEAPKIDAPPAALKKDPTTINKMTGTERAE